jgi:hypothetical protein
VRRAALSPALVDAVLADPVGWYGLERAALLTTVWQAGRGDTLEHCWDLSLAVAELARAVDWLESRRDGRDAAVGDRADRDARDAQDGADESEEWGGGGEWGEAAGRGGPTRPRAVGDSRGEALITFSLGLLDLREARFTRARTRLEWAATLFEQLGEERWCALTQQSLAVMDRARGAQLRPASSDDAGRFLIDGDAYPDKRALPPYGPPQPRQFGLASSSAERTSWGRGLSRRPCTSDRRGTGSRRAPSRKELDHPDDL